jgi:hypothetical protein
MQAKKSHLTEVGWLKVSNQRSDEAEQVFDRLLMRIQQAAETCSSSPTTLTPASQIQLSA